MSSQKSLSTDYLGQVVGIPHHDGHLEAIVFSGGSSIRLDLTDSSGAPHSVVLRGRSRFLANNVREGNIIDRMYLWPLADAPASAIARARQALHLRDQAFAELVANGQMLFVLESSYGLDVCAIVDGADLLTDS